MHFNIVRRRSKVRPFGWQFVADNGEIVAPSQGYTRKASAQHTVDVLKQVTPDTEVRDLTGRKP